jgi:phosphoesterase RecJ-like protein
MNSFPAITRLDQSTSQQIWDTMLAAQNIAIISHRHPDPDCIGSNLVLRNLLEKLGKRIDSVCVDIPGCNCRKFRNIDNFLLELDPARYDLLITLDCGSLAQTGFEQILSTRPGTTTLINIDHHASNNNYGTLNLVYPELSSTCEIMFLLLESWKQPINPETATLLMMGIYFDTGSFMHPNVSQELLDIAGQLTMLGADLPFIHKNLFQNFSLNKFHLWGKIMEDIRVSPQGTAVAIASPDHIQSPDFCPDDVSGVINYVSMAKNSRFALMLTQDKPGQIRGSLRTRQNDVDVEQIAGQLGGGGHKKASGFGFPAQLEKQTVWKITQ